jgi:hypothetical protein
MPSRKVLNKTLVSGSAVVAAVTGTGISCEHYTEVNIFFRCTSVSGTSPTIDFDIELSHDGTNWHKVADVTQITAAVNLAPVQLTNIGKWIRVTSSAPGGSSTPTLTMADIVATFKT